MSAWSDAVFRASRVALVGASETAGKLGRLLMDNLMMDAAGRERAVFPVHPKASTICGLPAFPSVSAISGGVDLAVLAVRAAEAPTVIADCGHARVPAAIVISGGFAETGPEGCKLEAALLEQAIAGGVRLIGPNCFGVVDTLTGLNASISQAVPHPGGVSLVTQSGAYGMAALTRSREDGTGFAKIVALGNKADLDESDLLEELGRDEDTRVVALLLESIRRGRRFMEILAGVSARKPVVVLKTGKSRGAQRAAESHTAALSGDAALIDAALRQAGAHVVEDGLTLLDVADALVRQPMLRGRRVAIVTNSGGTGVELTDLLESRGLEVPKLSDRLQAAIRPALPAHGSSANPIDVTTDWARFPAMYGTAMEALLASGEVDAVVPVLLQRSALMPEVADRIAAAARAAARTNPSLPIHVCWVAPREAEDNRRRLIAAGVPCHPWPERAARALAGCRAAAPDVAPLPPRQVSGPSDQPASQGWLPAADVFALLAEAGLPVVPWRLGRNGDEARRAAEELGFPLVLKAERHGILHKTESGAVRLNVRDPAVVTEVVAEFEARFGPGPTLLQRQIGRGVELVIGARVDPQFGPMVLAGLGGIWAEAMADVALRLAPVSPDGAVAMLSSIRGRTLLTGLRGFPAVDIPAAATFIARVSQWFVATAGVAELDLNPVIAIGNELWIVDARARMAPEAADCPASDRSFFGSDQN
ncbi:MAG: acetate--CoA ligase family protein [Betaproteobacteria bacterium]|nr:acetate--CoA ligase family protein [Betaproteobacteria bacterium]